MLITKKEDREVFGALMSDAQAKKKKLPYKQKFINHYGREDYKLKNTHLLAPAALYKQEHGYYTNEKLGSREYYNYFDQEVERCLFGYSCGSIRITGYHYHFLNYTNIEVTKTKSTSTGRAISRKAEGFPRFVKAHYDWFWCVDIAEYGLEEKYYKMLGMTMRVNKSSLEGGKHLICLKSRRVGWSMIAASMMARDFSMCKAAGEFRKSFALAARVEFLQKGDGLLDKVWPMLAYHNTHTNGLFYQPRQGGDVKMTKRAQYIDPDTNDPVTTGGMVEGKVVDNPNKARGVSGYKIYMEEFGSFPKAENALGVILPAVEEGGYVIGNIIAFGTGGEEGESIKALENLFKNPERKNFFSVDNSHLERGLESSGVFISAQEASFRFLDEDGNPLIEEALAFYESERDKVKDDIKAFQEKIREIPFKPSEALRQSKLNFFPTEKLVMRKERLQEEPKKYMVGNLEYIWEGKAIVGVRFQETPGGKIKILELPEPGENGIPDHMYIAGIDGIDIGSGSSAESTKGSDFCMVVKKRGGPLQSNSNKYVAYYMDRPYDEEEAFNNALKLSVYYNCEINLERARVNVRNYFRLNKDLGDQSYRFCKPPRSIATDDLTKLKNSSQFGTPATEKNNLHSDGRVKYYIDNFVEEIDFPEFLQQALDYSYTKRGNYDLIVAWGMCEILDESYDIDGKVVEMYKPEVEIVQYGYYTVMEKGYKIRKFGPIPSSRGDGSDPFGFNKMLNNEPSHIDRTEQRKPNFNFDKYN